MRPVSQESSTQPLCCAVAKGVSRPLRLALLAIVAFAVVLLLRWPLGWALPLLPKSVHCEWPAGTLWNGHCASLSARLGGQAFLLGEVNWQMQPWQLWRGRLALAVSLSRGPVRATAVVHWGINHLEVLNLSAQGPLDPAYVPGFPATWRGALQINGVHLRLDKGRLTAVEGSVRANQLASLGPASVTYGSYLLQFPPASGDVLSVGQIRDEGGPLQVQASLRVTPALDWQLDGLVAARASTDPALAKQIQYLGSPDAQGLRPFSMAGSL